MNIVEIKKDNVEDFEDLLGADLSSDARRFCFKGVGAIDDDSEVHGALVFELFNADSEDDTLSNIVFFKWESDEIRDDLLKAYDKQVNKNDIVTTTYETEDPELAGFFESIGFSKESGESRKVCCTAADLMSMPLKLGVKLPESIIPLNEVTLLQYRNAVKNFIVKGVKGSLEDLAYLEISWFERDISVCSTSDGKVDGVFLIRKTPSGVLQPCLYSAYGPMGVKNLGAMLIFAAGQTIEKYSPDTVIRINRHSEQVKALCAKMLSGVKGNTVFTGKRDE